MGIRDRLKDSLRRAIAPRPEPPQAPPPRPIPRYRDADALAELNEPQRPVQAQESPKPAPDPSTPAPPNPAPQAQPTSPPQPAQPTSPPGPPQAQPSAQAQPTSQPTRYKVHFLNAEEEINLVVEVNPGELVLDAGERAGLPLPYSCRNGGCTSCTAQLVSGELVMGEQYTLEPEQIAAGYRLLCCAEAKSDVVVLTHKAEMVS